ncbi:hypothetical protein VIGAN_04034400 [Vigna angularis var. angularis]|uniref:Uncharacterized protein n=1 Tax=Vigna angularis var. angularis TaxID=157739 RepID=A0A0S3RRI5_PHAAN|nr:hypothetical protein VIGAN_04034400 [Vigna angularis var. angularis]
MPLLPSDQSRCHRLLPTLTSPATPLRRIRRRPRRHRPLPLLASKTPTQGRVCLRRICTTTSSNQPPRHHLLLVSASLATPHSTGATAGRGVPALSFSCERQKHNPWDEFFLIPPRPAAAGALTPPSPNRPPSTAPFVLGLID